MRQIVAGNWKMNLGPTEATAFMGAFRPVIQAPGPRVALFPPALSLAAVQAGAEAVPGLELGVQNVHHEGSGAFTGEVSAPMAADAGATLVLVGHSERRHVFGETDADVARKCAAVVKAGLIPMICVGETLEERRGGRLKAVLSRQLDAVLDVLPRDREWILAYEPVWAIGTGETATPADASEAHAFLRGRMGESGRDDAADVPIIYGGSVKPGNAGELMAAPEVDGVLVGGASLDPEDFTAIVEAARR